MSCALGFLLECLDFIGMALNHVLEARISRGHGMLRCVLLAKLLIANLDVDSPDAIEHLLLEELLSSHIAFFKSVIQQAENAL